jgi:imidazolonepropionase-like amidohydrolase
VPTLIEATVEPEREVARLDSLMADSAVWRRMPASVAAEWRAAYPRNRALLRNPDYVAYTAAIRAGLADVRAVQPRLLAGTDVGIPFVEPGASLHTELQLLVRHLGLTPLQALQSATLEPARFLGMTDSLGTVQVGKVADLVLLGADPLADVRHTTRIEGVVANGRWLAPGRD